MNVLNNINTFACGPTADDPFTFVLMIIAVVVACVVAAVSSICG